MVMTLPSIVQFVILLQAGKLKWIHYPTITIQQLFPLMGQHTAVDCKSCHESMIFSEVSTDCKSCHDDIHNQTVGFDCARCHNTENWLVDNILDIHIEEGFPLLGVHNSTDCKDCHTLSSALEFVPIGNECINCHRADFESTTQPDHVQLAYSEDCTECHNVTALDWGADGFLHDFFPLTLGHDINDCNQCHLSEDYSNISTDCISCHQVDFQESANPDHETLNFSTDCASCHTTNPGWMPAEFLQHDMEYFPIYSGSHQGEWNACVDCHTNPADYSEFSCTNCHELNETTDEHEDVPDFVYDDRACLACHPTGSEDSNFDHNETNFPLTGAHIGVSCLECHENGFAGTPTDCTSCHNEEFLATTNPNHVDLGISSDCNQCHTTDPDWVPATFDIHDDYYELKGAHDLIANDCVACHNGNYNSTPNTCIGCHAEDYSQTDDPPHVELQFSEDCESCHTETAWVPSTFDHDGQYFPIYSGSHNGEWSQCIDCHTNPSDYSLFTCVNCHENPETDEEHLGVGGYVYEDNACLACHPTGDADDVFDHNNTNFPLTGGHINVDCLECHADGFEGTSTDCFSCHETDFNNSVNPNHMELDIPTDCDQCHTTGPGWITEVFPIHDDYYQLTGGHIGVDCASCHNGDYVNNKNTCEACHFEAFETATNPNHKALDFSTDCEMCHTTNPAWEPAEFAIHDEYYPLTGGHIGVDCVSCHNGDYENTPNTCAACHTDDFTSTTNPDHEQLGISMDCEMCHTTIPGWSPAAFEVHDEYYPLIGAHVTVDCESCHNGDYENTPNTCEGCHIVDYNQSTNPNHTELGLSTDCEMCHTTAPGWSPAEFEIHDDYYELTGGHVGVDCASLSQWGLQQYTNFL